MTSPGDPTAVARLVRLAADPPEPAAFQASMAAGRPGRRGRSSRRTKHAEFGVDDELAVDPAAAALLLGWFARGDVAMRRFAPSEEPILWPEHFDLGVTADEINYGVSPGDGGHPLPYAYVGPWTPRQGAFWNAPFGADRPAEQLPDAESVAAFFAAGRAASAVGRFEGGALGLGVIQPELRAGRGGDVVGGEAELGL